MCQVSEKDRARLRALADRQMQIATSNGMRALYCDWIKHGSFQKTARPMLTIEMWTFADDVIPALLQCSGKRAREIETMLLSNIIPYDYFKDDTPVPAYLNVPLKKHFVPLGLEVRKQDANNSGSVGVGHHFDTYLHDLEEDWSKLGQSSYTIDLQGTMEEVDELNGLFGDLLPARRGGEALCVDAAEDIIHLIAMEDLYIAMYDAPDRLHEMMERLLVDYGKYLDRLEESKLILPTALDEHLPQGSYCFTDLLPSEGEGLKTNQVWGHMNAEELNDVSPTMYKEFIIDHYKHFTSRFGALSFGCCEAVHKFWDGCIEELPNLRKVSISAWCDQRFMGERLKNRPIIFLRKPTANLLGVGCELDEQAVRDHFRETAEAASGC
ncbi:MAG: hypothetical protein RR824_12925, partial [Clostridia bacterium]